MPEHHLLSVVSTVQHVMNKHGGLLEGVLTHSQQRVVASLMQTSYAPQSGEIFGILQHMLETFETNLAGAQKDEQAAVKAFEELKASKEEEIAAATELKNRKAKDLAGADEKLANMKIDLDDTRAKLGADQQFLMMLKEKCEMTDKEWEERTKTRQLEMEAVSKALAILNSDDAHDTFTRTFTFVQKEAAGHRFMRSQAAELLTTVAKNLTSWQDRRSEIDHRNADQGDRGAQGGNRGDAAAAEARRRGPREGEQRVQAGCGRPARDAETPSGRAGGTPGVLRKESRSASVAAGARWPAPAAWLQGVQEEQVFGWSDGDDRPDHQGRQGNGG